MHIFEAFDNKIIPYESKEAFESYMNISGFIGNYACESVISHDFWRDFKEKVKKFLASIWNTIRNFFAQFFVDREVMLHPKAIDNITKHVKTWDTNIKDACNREIMRIEDTDSTKYGTEVIDAVDDIIEESDRMVRDNQTTMGAHHTTSDYRIYKKNEINALEKWTTTIETIITRVIKKCDEMTNSGSDSKILDMVSIRTNNIITRVAKCLTKVNENITKALIDARFDSRKDAGNQSFGKDIQVSIEL